MAFVLGAGKSEIYKKRSRNIYKNSYSFLNSSVSAVRCQTVTQLRLTELNCLHISSESLLTTDIIENALNENYRFLHWGALVVDIFPLFHQDSRSSIEGAVVLFDARWERPEDALIAVKPFSLTTQKKTVEIFPNFTISTDDDLALESLSLVCLFKDVFMREGNSPFAIRTGCLYRRLKEMDDGATQMKVKGDGEVPDWALDLAHGAVSQRIVRELPANLGFGSVRKEEASNTFGGTRAINDHTQQNVWINGRGGLSSGVREKRTQADSDKRAEAARLLQGYEAGGRTGSF
uniref:Movement protein n=1 Tax=Grapevine Kizil Sapak virus TaxID=2650001 RepID=A0A6J4CV12_9VIRU|nr:movement protein [Grapevine Kizil Sapak virus]